MTPLLGTKNPSAPVGAKSGRNRRAARSLLPCAAWGGYGAAWATRAAASLFTIVRHSSAKNIVLVQCPLYVHTGNGACKVFTKHETRITAFMLFTKHEIRPFPAKPQTQAAVEQRPYHPRGFWGHETRNTNHGFFSPWVHKGRTIRNPRPGPPRTPPGRCFPVRCGAAWCGMARLWSGMGGRRPPHRQHGQLGFHESGKTRHETRLFPVPAAIPRRATPSPTNRFSRIRKNETRNTAFFAMGAQGTHNQKPPPGPPLTPPGRCFPVRGGAAWCGMARLWSGMGGRRPPHRQHGLLGFHHPRGTKHDFPRPCGDSKESSPNPDQRVSRITKHETRNTNHGLYSSTSHESRNTVFPVPAATPRRATPSPTNGFHESRNTRHETRITAFILPPATNHETRFSPSLRRLQGEQLQARPTGFTNHETRDTKHESRPLFFHQPRGTQHGFPCPCGDSKESNPKPDQQVFHESRDTRHESRPLCFPTHHFPPFPTISRHFPAIFGPPPPTPTDQGFARRPPFWVGLTKSAVRWKSHKNAQNPGSHRKMREAQRSPRSRCRERRINPCRERRTFRIAQTPERSKSR